MSTSAVLVGSELAAVTALVDQIPGLDAAGFTVAELPGGLTNRNYVLAEAGEQPTRTGRKLVLRRSDPQSALLSIDRECEYRNSLAAAAAGVGPAVIGYLRGQGALVVEWIEARTFTDADLADSAALARVARTCARLHAGPRFVNDFDMFDIQRGYLQVVLDRGFQLPAGYLELMPTVERMRTALAVNAPASVPCHNDLLAANIMDDGERTWFIDFEYAGNNDPCFELGNIWSEANLAPEQLVELVEGYFAHPSTALVARARLFAVMAQYGWLLWASIQAATSSVEFDFWGWGLQKYDRAVAAFDHPQFDDWLNDLNE
jgi:thiamine kinase-like enzyme